MKKICKQALSELPKPNAVALVSGTDFGKKTALCVSVLSFLALLGSPVDASAAQFFMNDSVDGECANMRDGNSPGTPAYLYIVPSAACNVNSVAALAATGQSTGTLSLNGNGAFLLGKLNISGALDVNNNQIHSVAAGVAPTDAANLTQLQAVGDSVATTLGGGASANSDGTITAPVYNVQGARQNTIGDALNALDVGVNNAVAYDRDTGGATNYNSVTLGNGEATGPVALHNVANGSLSNASTDAVNGAQLYSTNQQVDSNTADITNLGGRVTVNEGNINDLLIGHAGLVQQADGTAPVTIAASSGGTVVDVTGTDGSRRITGLANGDLSATSSDAVNGSQLYATNQNVATNAQNIGNLGDRVTVNEGNIGDLLIGHAGLVQQADGDATVTVAASSGGSVVDVTGTGGGRRITGLANGDISSTSSDAVNGSQLYATNQNVAANTQNIGNLGNRVTFNEGNIGDLLIGHAGLVQQADSNAPITIAANNGGSVINAAGTAGDRRVNGVADGTLDNDAVNLGQLKDVQGQVIDLSDLVVLYDSTGKQSITLGGTGASAPVAIHNLADGALSATSADAVNGAQLYSTNQHVATNAQNISNLGDRVTVNEGNIGDLLIGHAGLVQQADANAPVTVAANNGGSAVNISGTAGNRQLKGVAAGTEDDDAVNLSQLNDLSDQVGVIDNAAVKYDDSSKTSVTLGGVGASAPVVLRNVADGELSAASHEAVNGGQLYATNENVTANAQHIDKLDGRVTVNEGNINDLLIGHAGLVQQVDTNAPVTVAVASGGTVVDITGTAGDRQITGVAAGTEDNDAVNLSQLNDLAGYVGDLNALAVKYDDTSKTSVTLGGADATSPVALRNIAGGELSATSHDAVNGSQLYGTNQQVESNTGNIDDLLIGHAGMVQQADASAPVTVAANSGGTLMTVNGTDGDRQIRGVAAGTQDNDAVNLSQLNDLAGYVGDIDALAVKYDDTTHGSVTLGGVGATAPVAIHNVANGVSTFDAVNFGQLSDLQNNLQTQIGGLDTRVTVLENEDRTPPYLDGAGGSGANEKANAGDTPGVALGYNTVATGDNASAVGQNAQALGSYGLAVGNDSYAAGDNDTAIGGNAKVHADNSLAVGVNSTVAAGASNAVAVGANSNVNAASGTAVGQGATVSSTATNAVAIGAGSVADRADTVSVGATGAERQVTNVAAGTQTTDAVNVGQLQNLQDWTGAKIDDLQQLINRNQRQANRGIASSAALVNNMPYVPGKVALSAGAASYRGESALGVAVSRWSKNGRVNLNAGISVARGDAPIFRVGVGVVLGE